MNDDIDFQIIEQAGQPAFAVVEYGVFMDMLAQRNVQNEPEEDIDDGKIPKEILERHTLYRVPLVRAWREHLGMTQGELEKKSGINQPSIARIEKGGSNPQKRTIERLASAMNLKPSQLEL